MIVWLRRRKKPHPSLPSEQTKKLSAYPWNEQNTGKTQDFKIGITKAQNSNFPKKHDIFYVKCLCFKHFHIDNV